MLVAEFCRTELAVVERSSTLSEAARKMRELHLGDVVVCDLIGDHAKPIGILTDRDIVVGVIALDMATETVRIEEVMTPILVTVEESASVHEAIRLMENYALRQIPVVDRHGSLVGIISSSDLLQLMGRELASLSSLPSRQKRKEHELRS